LLAAAFLSLAGCGASSDDTADSPAAVSAEQLDKAVASSAKQMQSALDKMSEAERNELRASVLMRPRNPRIAPMDSPAVNAPLELAPVAAARVGGGVEAGSPPPGFLPPASGLSKADGLASDFGRAVRPQGLSPSLLHAMQLSARAAGEPAALKELAALEPTLSASDRAVLAAFTSMLTAAGDPATKTEADWAKLLADHAAALKVSGTAGVAIVRTALCRRVEAFGRYTPIDSGAFVAGRPIAALVYVELEQFGYKPTSKAWLDGPVPDADASLEWEVQIAQEIELLTSAGISILRIPETTARDVSRSKRREFYLVQRIDLPSTLAAGGYTLKIRVRDLANGAEAESNIPLTLAADGATAALNAK